MPPLCTTKKHKIRKCRYWVGALLLAIIERQNRKLPETYTQLETLLSLIVPSGGSLPRRFRLDDLGVWVEAGVLGLGRAEVGHELILVGLLHGRQPVCPGPRQPLPLLLVVRKLGRDARLILKPFLKLNTEEFSQGCGSGRIQTFLGGSGKFLPDIIGTLAM